MAAVLPTWEMTLNVYGPITVKNRFNFKQRKDLLSRDRLYSEIEISRNGNFGIVITLTAYATEQMIARKAALYFCGQALDALVANTNIPIMLSLTDHNSFSPKAETEKRILLEDELIDAFKNSRLWLLTEPTFLRAVGWYRKGLYTEDPFDKFLAFYNSIETLSCKYNPNAAACADRGSKCHIWETFKARLL